MQEFRSALERVAKGYKGPWVMFGWCVCAKATAWEERSRAHPDYTINRISTDRAEARIK